MVKAKDVMTKDVMTITSETPIEIAIKILAIRKMSGFPVVDADKKLIGIISEKDLMGLLLDDKIEGGKTVADYMTKDVMFFSSEENLATVCEFLMEKPFRRVPILEGEKLVGLISRGDIISYIWKEKISGN